MTTIEQRAIENATRKSYAKPVLVKGPQLTSIAAEPNPVVSGQPIK